MKVNYNQDNVKDIANTVSEIMENEIIDIESLESLSNVSFKDNLHLYINNDFGRITKIDLSFSKEYVHNYSVVLECKPFQIQGQIWKKLLEKIIWENISKAIVLL